MRARRLVAVASVAVGLVALAGCRSEPGVAAYVGDHRITEDAVTAVIEDARSKNPTPTEVAETLPGQEPQLPGQEPQLPGRSQVVSTLVLTEVCERISAAEGYQSQGQVEPAQVAQGVGLNPETEYVRQVAELYTCLSGIPVGAPVAPTEQELIDLVAAGKRAGAVPADVTVEQAASQLDGDQLRQALASRDSLSGAVEAYDVTVNPRYRPLVFPVLSFTGQNIAVGVPLGEPASDTVTDISTPKPQLTPTEPTEPTEPTDG
ncbi:hypothetical protein SAMN05443287_105272 [Micromonospora phaseoli]|uniref:SurA N-terminal domain-containing protein n=1 Tax=Micromonospora phaseoli TaxID=1144548 RepID=A0A1H7A3S8_9ACTN|nr:hypothetical protein [Micromonospora phaseoli]PZV97032.1 hypothetical protein CLV64_106140 [Micromonospora phaseoli]SEJ56510.1 hypothetical protein SAMN05443287_105272 [Micromonospora phaseoli]